MDKILVPIYLIVITGLLVGFLATFSKAVERHERWECEEWLQQEKLYNGFFWSPWQRQQCNQFFATSSKKLTEK